MGHRLPLDHTFRSAFLLATLPPLAAACSAISGLDDFELTGGTVATGNGGGTSEVGTAAGGGGAGGAPQCTPGVVEPCDPYKGPSGTEGVGVCRAAQRTCTQEGTWSACDQEVIPQEKEILGDDVDDDCDGTALAGKEHLLVRYLINEDPAEQPNQIHDTAASPLNLTIVNPSLSVLSVAEDAQGRRGLQWTTAGNDSRASAEIIGTKVQTNLDQRTTATIELVTDLRATVEGTRVISIGHLTPGNPFEDLSLPFDDAGYMNLHMADIDAGRWLFDFAHAGRVAVHLVVNTAEPDPDARRKLYVNGDYVPSDPGEMIAPSLNQPIDVALSAHLSIGTRYLGDTSPEGMVYYAAIYTDALSDDEIQNNTTLLLIDDDHP